MEHGEGRASFCAPLRFRAARAEGQPASNGEQAASRKAKQSHAMEAAATVACLFRPMTHAPLDVAEIPAGIAARPAGRMHCHHLIYAWRLPVLTSSLGLPPDFL